MAVDLQGNIIDDAGNKLGGQVDLNTGVLNSSSLAPSPSLDIPQSPTATNMTGAIDTNLEALLTAFNQPTKEEQTGDELQNMILSSINTLSGESARKTELEAEAGLPQQRTELQSVVNQLQTLQKQSAAVIPQVESEMVGRASIGAISGEQQARQRVLAVQSLGLAAIGQTLQGNISLAESSIQNALQAEFEPERLKLQTLERIYEMNKDALERVDKKRADNLNILLGERERILNIQEANKEEIYKIGTTAAKYGADTATVQRIFSSGSREDALAQASQFLQDPQAKIELEGAKLNNALRRVQIAREQAELALFNKYGGMSPSEYANALKEEQEAIDKAEDENDKAILQGRAIGEKITLLGGILNSPGLDTVVGATFLTRGSARQKEGFFGKTSSFVKNVSTLGLTTGVIDEISGSADNVINMTEQFISKEFLQNLIDVKAQGATFGALQKAEQDALTASATKIGESRIREGGKTEGKVIGYDMSETDFRKEVEKIQEFARMAYERATGESFTSDEQQLLDSVFSGSSPALFDPNAFYNK